MTKAQRGELRFDVLPSDDLYGSDRGRAVLHYGADWASGWRARVDAENVSDPEYFEDFAQGPEGTSVAFAARNAEVSYRGENWRLLGQVQHFQTIDRNLAASARPYARLPRLLAAGNYRFGPLFLQFDGETVNFSRGVGVNGWRTDLMPRAGFTFEAPGWYLRPAAGYRYTGYRLDDVAVGAPRSPQRSMPFAQLDAGLILERDGGSSRRVTLEPRLQYLYVPFRDQSQLPVFDTALPDQSLFQLFSGNRYIGADRVNDANQVTTALTARIFDSSTGREKLTATLGETWYLRSPRVSLPGEVRQLEKRGDVIAELGLQTWRHWNVGASLQWNPEASRSERAQLRLQYQPAPDRVVNLAYRTQYNTDLRIAGAGPTSGLGRLEQAEVSAAWPIRDRWQLFARNVYDLGTRQSLDQFVGPGIPRLLLPFAGRGTPFHLQSHRRARQRRLSAAGTQWIGQCRNPSRYFSRKYNSGILQRRDGRFPRGKLNSLIFKDFYDLAGAPFPPRGRVVGFWFVPGRRHRSRRLRLPWPHQLLPRRPPRACCWIKSRRWSTTAWSCRARSRTRWRCWCSACAPSRSSPASRWNCRRSKRCAPRCSSAW